MDMSKFLDDNFDAKEWVNEAFCTHKDSSIPKDQHATSLVMKLQKFIQEVSGVIEETSQQALQNLPRVMREIDAVRQEAVLLKEQMRTVKHDIQKVEENTSKSMQSLLNLDMIKGRIKEAADALKEADNWTTLAAGVDDVFQSQDVNAIRDKLVGMQQSLQMLIDTPDYKDRCQYLEQLKNRLEALLSPQLVAAFNAQALEPAQLFTRIFIDIDRLPQLHKYYHKCQKGQLLQSWTAILETNTEASLSDWITEYFDLLLSTWYSQLKWCGQVFEDPVPIVCDLLSETLNSLDPALGTLTAQQLQRHGNVLGTLTDLHEMSERFDKSMEKAIEAQVADSAYLTESLWKLREAIYAPYKPYMDKYRAFEEASLERELENIPLDKPEVLDTVQLLGQSVNRLFAIASQANDRCLKLSTGCCYLFLLDALKTYFSSYTHEFRRVLVNIREKCLTGPRIPGQDEDDWTHFQQSLRIIQTCGELILRLDELDQRIIINILSSLGRRVTVTSPIVKSSDEGPFPFVSPLHLQASLLLSNQDDILALESLVVRLEEGDMTYVLAEVKTDFCQLSEDVHKFAFDIVFAQLKIYLTGLADMEIWKAYSAGGAVTSDLPTYSLSPQEYITKIGQYLLTVPQQLEPFTLQDNAAVLVALKHGRLPYTDEQELPEHTADLWLESIAQGTMHVYSEEILRIIEITTHATKQLCTDIAYLCNVLEDLGLHPSDTLTNIEQLLKVAPELYKEVAEKMPQRLSNAVSGMRGIEI